MKILLALAGSAMLASATCQNAQKASTKNAQTMSENSKTDSVQTRTPSGTTEIATLGGGCFWCVEAIFQDLKGVSKVASGYSGGSGANPTYNEVCSGLSGHAEVVQVTFDPGIITFREILDIFFTVHDPTTLNRQGADVGTQYRSVIFYHSEKQKEVAEEAKKAAADIWDSKIVTEIAEAKAFYVAENYHQNYYKDNPYQPYCQAVIAPKVKKFRQRFVEKLKEK